MTRKKHSRPLIGITVEVLRHDRKYTDYDYCLDHRYSNALEKAGGLPVLLPITENRSYIDLYASLIDGLLISGGADIPPRIYREKSLSRELTVFSGRIDFEKELIQKMFEMKKPVFAICYGMQLINIILGGTLYQDIRRQRPSRVRHRSERFRKHLVRVNRDSILKSSTGKESFPVESEHHQGIKVLGKDLKVVATAKDGMIEAVEYGKKVLAVQWHPERQSGIKVQSRIFRYFVKLCT